MSEHLAIVATSTLDRLDQAFWLLGVDPAATNAEIKAAVEQAKQRDVAPEDVLNAARDALLDPVRRLSHELAYPLGSPVSEVDEWHRLASTGFNNDDLLKRAGQLSPLGQANFFHYLSTQRSADPVLLCAMIDAFGRIEPTSVYDQVKDARRRAGCPPPSLAQVYAQLDTQLEAYCRRTISAYCKIDEASTPLCEVVRQVLTGGEGYQIEVLERLLGVYQEITRDERSSRLGDVETACDEIEGNPNERAPVEALAVALDRWVELSRPLLLYQSFGHALDDALLTPLQRLRSLVIDLALYEEYERAIEIAGLCKERLSIIATTATLLDEAAVPAVQAYRMRRDRQLGALKSLIASHKQNPAVLVEAIKQGGFGPGGAGVAGQLWQTFADTVSVTKGAAGEPCLEIRALARWLHGWPAGKAAGRSVLEGCLQHGPQIGLPPTELEAIRDELDHLKRSKARTPVRPTKAVSRLFFYAAGGATILLCVAAPMLFGALQPAKQLVTTLAGSFVRATASPTVATIEEETAPAVGTQQRLTLANLRYCRFQEERLRLIKPKIQNAEDMRAFNLLAVDYNSRCSDFLFRDADSLVVQAELLENRQRLVEDADRIASTWHGLAAQRQPAK